MGRDSVLGTLLVATVLCVVCSVLVSSSAVLLYKRQEANKALDKRKNVLLASGLIASGPDAKKVTPKEINVFFDEKRVTRVLVDLQNATVVADSEDQPYDEYNARDAADSEAGSVEITTDGPTPGVDRREKLAFVYQVMEDGSKENVVQYVLPIYGKGLWSTLYGFIAIDADGKTIRGITFYEHGETPGLGGEVDNQKWKDRWSNSEKPKFAYDDQNSVAIRVIKGTVDPNSDDAKYQVDGLSGATITTNGVSKLVQYWLGPDGFGPYLQKQTDG
jgi:Na+-transporting NADH:ubiquinone oxidoreductase subunit C